MNAPRPTLVLITVGLAAFMSTLDGSIVNVSLPEIRRALSVGIAETQWVVMGYLLVMSGLLLTFGRLGDMLGHRRVFLSGFAIFAGASLWCGLAPSIGWLVSGRAVQAIGAACMQSVSAAILTGAFPASRRGRALGLLSLFTYGGLTLGPSVGGYITSSIGWRWIFLVNLPVCAAALIVGALVLPRESETRQARFDFVGAALWFSGLGAAMVALSFGTERGFGPVWIATLALGLLLLGAFLWQELRADAPMIDLGLFKSVAFSGGIASALMNYVAVFSIMFLTPFRLVDGLGLEAASAGRILTAMPLAMAVAAPASGALSDRIGTRLPATFGMIALAAGLLLLGAADSLPHIVGALALCGIGTGAFISPNTSAVLGAAPNHRQGVASGLVATARTTGMVLGVAASGAVYAVTLAGAGAKGAGAFSLALLPGVVAATAGALASSLRPSERRS